MRKRAQSLLRRFRAALRGSIAFLTSKSSRVETESLRLFYRSRAVSMTRATATFTRALRSREARIWVDGRSAFHRLHRWINRAQGSIVIRMFIWKDDETGRMMRDALISAADRGVAIHIWKEASGDLFEVDHPFLETKEENDAQWKKFWHHPNIAVHYGATRDHTKIYIIDGHITLLTGMNIADEYRLLWHDYLVELRGTRFADMLMSSSMTRDRESAVRLVLNQHRRMDVRPVIEKALYEAKKSIVVEHCYFTDERIASILIAKSHEGVRCTVIIPSGQDVSRHATLLVMDRLRREGHPGFLQILTRPGMFHAKVLLIDGWTCIMGSANLNPLSLDRTGEACVLLSGKIPAVRKMRRSLRKEMLRSSAKYTGATRILSRILAILGL